MENDKHPDGIADKPTGALRYSARAIIVREGCLLAIRNVDPQGDWYILPGGGQRFGETLVDALKRECMEEAGASVRVGALRLVREYIGSRHGFGKDNSGIHAVELMFECELEGAYSPNDGHLPDKCQTGVAWLPLAELEKYRLYPEALTEILEKGSVGATPIYLGDVN